MKHCKVSIKGILGTNNRAAKARNNDLKFKIGIINKPLRQNERKHG